MSYTLDFSVALGSGSTGLTLKAQLVNSAGADVGSEVTTGFTEIGAGNYLWSGTIPDDHQGGVIFMDDDDTVLAFSDINPPPTSTAVDPAAIAAAVGEIVIDNSINLKQTLALIGAAVAGGLTITATGVAGQSTIKIKDMNGTTTRIQATVTNIGERLSVTLSPPN